MEKDNLKKLKKTVVNKGLCTSCGTCIGMCPANAIAFDRKKIVNGSNKCIECGACIRNCPGKEFDYKYIHEKLFNEPYDNRKIIGSYRGIYVGHSNNGKVWESAASGGIVTEMAIYLLESHQIDGAVVITGGKNGRNVEAKIARNKEEILDAAQSKYQLVPTNVVVRKILSEEGRYLYVGLPCQIHGIRKAMDNNEILRNRIVLIVGLFCGFNMDLAGTEYLIRKSRIPQSEIIELSYRKKRNGDTGFYVSSDRKEWFVSKHEYTYLNLFFSPKRCSMCYDYAAEFADVSVGDAWERGMGWSRIITRTKIGQKALDFLIEHNAITIETSSEKEILENQKSVIEHKKKNIWYRWKRYKYIPDMNIGGKPSNLKVRARGKALYYIMKIGNNFVGRMLIYTLPFTLLRKLSRKLRK